VMNATTRSGTNSFHASAYDFLRNSVFDARNYFNQSPAPQDTFRRNQFGGTLGGPIVKNRMFFFVNYEGAVSYTHLDVYKRQSLVPPIESIRRADPYAPVARR